MSDGVETIVERLERKVESERQRADAYKRRVETVDRERLEALRKLGTALTALREIAGDEGCQTITVEMRIARDALEGLSDG